MPGPGGGSHGGGGSRGGGFGGGRGGGFGGGPYHRPPRGPHRGFFGGWYHRPYGYGGGCLGGMLSLLLLPIVIILVAVIMITSIFGNAFSSLASGGDVTYEENAFQDYADAQYAAEFGSSAAYEDHILIVFLVDEEYYDYNYIAWVGDHIATDINLLFGNEQTELGYAINSSVNQSSYKYSLDSNLAQVVERMETEITELGLSSSYRCDEDHADVDSHLTNKTKLPLTAETVDTALSDFTDTTGIPMVIVVEDMEDVFGRSMSAGSIICLIIAVGLIALAIFLIVRAVRNKRSGGNGSNSGNGYGQNQYNQYNYNNYNRPGFS